MVLFALRFGIEKEQLAQGLSNLDVFSRKRNMFRANFIFFFGDRRIEEQNPNCVYYCMTYVSRWLGWLIFILRFVCNEPQYMILAWFSFRAT